MKEYVRMTIVVPQDVYDQLRESARQEMRQPRLQAQWLLYQALNEMQHQGVSNANRAAKVLADTSAVA